MELPEISSAENEQEESELLEEQQIAAGLRDAAELAAERSSALRRKAQVAEQLAREAATAAFVSVPYLQGENSARVALADLRDLDYYIRVFRTMREYAEINRAVSRAPNDVGKAIGIVGRIVAVHSALVPDLAADAMRAYIASIPNEMFASRIVQSHREKGAVDALSAYRSLQRALRGG